MTTCRKVTESLATKGEHRREVTLRITSPTSLVQVDAPRMHRLLTLPNFILAIGTAALVLPTMFEVATETWTKEQGGHGPLVLATGLWAVWRELKGKNLAARPGSLILGLPLFLLALGVFIVTRIAGILEIEDFAMYGTVVAATYILFGGAVIRAIWFPLIYLAFALPPPDSVVAFVTQPVKIAISTWAVSALQLVGYPIASSGVTIQIGQYQLLVAAACAGLNSILTLTALCLFYVYLRHRSNPLAFLVIAVAAIPVAIISNFVRVLALVLITYYFGDAAAQGFVHDFAGLLMFTVALVAIFGIDQLVTPLVLRRFKMSIR